MRDLANNISVAQSIAPVVGSSDTNGTGIDLQGFESATIVVDTDGETPQVTSIGYVGGNRYVRVVADFTGTHSNGTPIAVSVIKGHPRHNVDADSNSSR